ncbi:MAG: ferritin-like domain-containing protein [Gemmatimonadaceae bacterium]
MSYFPREFSFDAVAMQNAHGRRRFLANLAVAAGAIALAPLIERGAGIGHIIRAQVSGESEPNLSDNDILNYALTLEYLEATFYLRGDSAGTLPTGAAIAALDPDGNATPGTVAGLAGMTFPSPSTQSIPTFFRAVRDHEITHVLTLQNALGNAALSRSAFKFNFGTAYSSAANFMNTAMALEDTGVSAYLGQVGNLEALSILSTLVTIQTVEAEHAASIRVALGQAVIAGDVATDTPKTTTQVLTVANAFITQAPALPFPK